MRNVLPALCLAFGAVLTGLSGCQKSDVAPTPAPAAPVAAPVTPQSTTTPGAQPPAPSPIVAAPPVMAPAAPVVEHIPDWAKANSELQQRILAIGAAQQQAQVRGDLTKEQMRKIGKALGDFDQEHGGYAWQQTLGILIRWIE